MTTLAPETCRYLAETLSPLAHALAAGLLLRPLAVDEDELETPEKEASPARLCADLDALLLEAVPALRAAMAELEDCEPEDMDEYVELLADPALELVDMARRIWIAPFPPEAESVRPLLATLAEAPPARLLQWILELMHLALDPWALAEDPETPEISFSLDIPDTPLREALADWRKRNPGLLPENALLPNGPSGDC
jgi:hypothetical protein